MVRVQIAITNGAVLPKKVVKTFGGYYPVGENFLRFGDMKRPKMDELRKVTGVVGVTEERAQQAAC